MHRQNCRTLVYLSWFLCPFCYLASQNEHNIVEKRYLSLFEDIDNEINSCWDEIDHIFNHSHSKEDIECFSTIDVVKEFNLSNASASNLSSSDLIQLCPALFYRSVTSTKCPHAEELNHEENEAENVYSTRIVFIYGTLAILLCSMLSLLGIPLVLCDRNSAAMQILLQFFIGLAVSSMACDAILHLWPMAVELHMPHNGKSESSEHEHSHDGGEHEDRRYLWRSVALVGALYLFFIFETLMHQSIDHRHTHSLASEEVDARRRDRSHHHHHNHHHQNHHSHHSSTDHGNNHHHQNNNLHDTKQHRRHSVEDSLECRPNPNHHNDFQKAFLKESDGSTPTSKESTAVEMTPTSECNPYVRLKSNASSGGVYSPVSTLEEKEPSVDFAATVLGDAGNRSGLTGGVNKQMTTVCNGGGAHGDNITCSLSAKTAIQSNCGATKPSNGIILTSCKDRERKSSLTDCHDPVGDHPAVPPENLEVIDPKTALAPSQPCVHHHHENAVTGEDATELVCCGSHVNNNMQCAEAKTGGAKFTRDSQYRASLRHLEKMGVATRTRFGIPEDKFALVMMIMFGDMFHNLTDGLAVGAAFGAGFGSGLATSIAVLFHELPHELGDFAILFDCGINISRILILNAISSLAAFAGLYIGVFLSEYEGSYEWIFAVTAGMFLYVAFIDMLPQMMHVNTNSPWIVYGVQNLGLVLGFFMMLLLSLYESH